MAIRKSVVVGVCGLLSLVMLPGCINTSKIKAFLFGKKEATSEESVKVEDAHQKGLVSKEKRQSMAATGDVLMTIDGKTVITIPEFEAKKERFFEENPQMKNMIPLIGPEFEEKFFDGVVNQAIINEYIKKEDIDRTETYKKDLQKTIESLKQMLNIQYFMKQLEKIEPTQSEIRSWYDKNKENVPEFIAQRGGVEVMAVAFDALSDAQSFLDRYKTLYPSKKVDAHTSFVKFVEENGDKDALLDFKVVNEKRYDVPNEIRLKVMQGNGAENTIILVESADKKKAWVVLVGKKKETSYRPLKDVNGSIVQLLVREKQDAAVKEKIDQLKIAYRVSVNNKHFAKKRMEKERALQDIMKKSGQEEAEQSQVSSTLPPSGMTSHA